MADRTFFVSLTLLLNICFLYKFIVLSNKETDGEVNHCASIGPIRLISGKATVI